MFVIQQDNIICLYNKFSVRNNGFIISSDHKDITLSGNINILNRLIIPRMTFIYNYLFNC